MPTQYYMRAYKTTPPTGYVDWMVEDVPDGDGYQSDYDHSELRDIIINYVDSTAASGGASVLSVGKIGILPNASDGYLLDMDITSDENYPAVVINSDTATLSRLIVTCTQKPTILGDYVTVTVRKNLVDTGLTVTLTLDSTTPAGGAGYIAKNLVNSQNVVIGDRITIRYESSAAANVQNLIASIEIG